MLFTSVVIGKRVIGFTKLIENPFEDGLPFSFPETQGAVCPAWQDEEKTREK